MARARLDQELVRRGLAVSRSAAQQAISDGMVSVKGVVEPKPATMISLDTPVRLVEEGPQFVSRGGVKLQAAVDAFGLDVSGRRALDAGASTGGFTDCLLQAGVHEVMAVDVGYGQLAWALRGDERVTVVDRVNIRYATPDQLGAPFGIVVADLSFISLELVLPVLAATLEEEGDMIVLVKPQFEVGKEEVGRGGVVRDPELHANAIRAVVDAATDAGLYPHGVVRSPIEGPAGNREFLLWLRSSSGPFDGALIEQAVQ